MIRVSCFNKMGDVVYALPAMRALARLHGEKIHLLASGSCWQLAPLLWEQPYIGEVELEDTKAHATEPIRRGAIFPHWHWYAEGEGYNLSLQPRYFADDAPISWTQCYLDAAGITDLTASDKMVLPSLVNHRRWMEGIEIETAGKRQVKPKTIVLAPETDTLDELLPDVWQHVVNEVVDHGYEPIMVGTRRIARFYRCTDLRGFTSVPVMARLIAESSGFIGAHSFPWHVARHSETPAVCLQTWREGLRRCIPIDTPWIWIDAKDYLSAVSIVLKTEQVPV